MTRDSLLAIGEVADATDVTVATIRYYDELGIVTPTSRVGGKRRFTTDAIGRVSFVRRAQATGMSLDDIKTILDDRDRQWPQIVAGHVDRLRQQRDELDTMIAMLEEVQRCGCDVVAECPRVSGC